MTDVVKWVHRVAVETIKSDIESLKELLNECIVFQLDSELVFLLEPLFIVCNPSVSDILSISHCVCNCCSLFTPCHVSQWIEKNSELFDSEVKYFHIIITIFSEYINFDLEPFEDVDLITQQDLKDDEILSRQDRLRQLLTIVLKYD